MVALILLLVLNDFVQFGLGQQNKAYRFLEYYNTKFVDIIYKKNKAMFMRSVNITKHNMEREASANDEFRRQLANSRKKAREIDLTDCNEDTRRQFKILLKTKQSLNNMTAKKVADLKTKMTISYETTIIPYKNGKVALGELIGLVGSSSNTSELIYAWKTWRKTTSSRLRDNFEEYVKLNNIGARENGFKDAGEFYRSSYDVENLQDIAKKLLKDLQPLYSELHGYVRYKLSEMYPDLIDFRRPIPAHIAGSIWAHSWESLYNRIVPYPKEPSLDVTPMIQEKKSILSMLEMAETFFTSLGWRELPKTFWQKSEFVKPKDREMECFPSALDLMGKIKGEPDLRIKMCTSKTQEDFVTIHHEIGHLYYNLLFSHQPTLFRDGANPGLREAVGDFIGLSVQTPAHLYAVGLLKNNSQTKEADINFLLKMALQQVSFLPFSFIVDHWRWKVYSGEITSNEYNAKWWEYREKYQGLSNPDKASKDDFDPSAIFHIAADVPYIRYFFATIFMFTFQKRACDLAKSKKPLHQCSIYNSKVAGREFKKMLELGCSKPWPEVVKQFTGSNKLSGEPIREYFNPLADWLKEYRLKNNYTLGWSEETYRFNNSVCLKPITFIYILMTFIVYLILQRREGF